MKTNKSVMQSKIISNSGLLSRNDVGILVFCDDIYSANSLARHLNDNLLKRDFLLGRHRVDDQVQDPGTIIEILTNINEVISLASNILKEINNIIEQCLLLSANIIIAAATLEKLIQHNPKLQKPINALLAIFNWSKKNNATATIEVNKISMEITPQKMECPESLLVEAIKKISSKENN